MIYLFNFLIVAKKNHKQIPPSFSSFQRTFFGFNPHPKIPTQNPTWNNFQRQVFGIQVFQFVFFFFRENLLGCVFWRLTSNKTSLFLFCSLSLSLPPSFAKPSFSSTTIERCGGLRLLGLAPVR